MYITDYIPEESVPRCGLRIADVWAPFHGPVKKASWGKQHHVNTQYKDSEELNILLVRSCPPIYIDNGQQCQLMAMTHTAHAFLRLELCELIGKE